jgi:hypothetical protein
MSNKLVYNGLCQDSIVGEGLKIKSVYPLLNLINGIQNILNALLPCSRRHESQRPSLSGSLL